MQNNNSNDVLQKDEINLEEAFKLLINSKKIIIVITLVITTLGVIYSFQRAPVYKSTALIEIGYYPKNQYNQTPIEADQQDQHNQTPIETAKSLINELTIKYIHRQKALKIKSPNLVIKSVMDPGGIKTQRSYSNRLIHIAVTSSSTVTSRDLINEIIGYIENRHSSLLITYTKNIENQLTNKIMSLNDQIEYSKNASLTQDENEKLRISNKIESLNNEIPTLDLKIKELNSIINEDQDNLKLLASNPDLFLQRASQSPTLNQVIYSYKIKLIDFEAEKIILSQEKDNLESQLQVLESNNLESVMILILSQEKNVFESELEFMRNQNPTNTQFIGEILTKDMSIKKELIILWSFIFGLSLSIIMVFINNSLKAYKEE